MIHISNSQIKKWHIKKCIKAQLIGLLLVVIIMNISSVININTFVKASNLSQTSIKTSGSIQYPIIAIGNEGGTIDPQGKTLVNYLDNITYTLTPKGGYYILDLLVDGSSVGPLNSYTFTQVRSNHTIEARFASIQYQLHIYISGEGTVDKNSTKSVFKSDESVQLTAVPSPGWRFSSWTGDYNGTTNPIKIVFNSNKNVIATFLPIAYHLNITTSGDGKVLVNPSNTTYSYGEKVKISAVPDSGWSFSGWSGDISGSAISPMILIDNDKNINANFVQAIVIAPTSTPKSSTIQNQTYYTINVSSLGKGQVVLNPNKSSYEANAIVTLTANPTNGWVFSGWGGDLSGSSNPISVTLDQNKVVAASFTQVMYTITASAGSGGSISPFGSVSVAQGSSQVFTITPSTGYHVSSVLVDGSSVGAVSSYTFSSVQVAHTISASFTQVMYTITASAGSGGSISPSGSVSVAQGSSQVFTITPSTGYHVSSVLVDGSSVGAVSSYTFSSVQVAHTISASFTQVMYTITASAGSGGSISPSGSVSVAQGSSQVFTITPSTGYHVSSVLVDGSSVGAVSSYTFSSVQVAHTISASFTQVMYTITASAGSGGSISPSGSVSVAQGSSQVFTITPSTGYHVSSVLVDGSSVGAVSSYTFSSVQVAHTISASFTQVMYTITASAGSGGSISPSGSVSVAQGSSQVFTITPSTGYHVSSVLVDGSSVGAVSSYTFSSVQVAHTISASFTNTSLSLPTPNYIVDIESSSYVTRNQARTVIVSNSNFVTMMNSLSSDVKSGDVIQIQNGTYPINSKIDWKTSGVTITGQSTDAILQSSSSYTSSEMMCIGGSGSNHIIINGLTFDNNFANNPWAPLKVCGSYNTVENCRFLNVLQYGLLAFAADHFQFLNNYCNKAQYGIATGGGLGYPFCTNGLIEGNTIVDAKEEGIKLRWCNNVTVTNNDIDVKWLTWMNQPKSDLNPSGICIYQADGPDINVVVKNNNIHNSGPAYWTSSGYTYRTNGIYIMPDVPANWGSYSGSSYGQVVTGNTISGVWNGIRNQFSPSTTPTISGNTYSNIGNTNVYVG